MCVCGGGGVAGGRIKRGAPQIYRVFSLGLVRIHISSMESRYMEEAERDRRYMEEMERDRRYMEQTERRQSQQKVTWVWLRGIIGWADEAAFHGSIRSIRFDSI